MRAMPHDNFVATTRARNYKNLKFCRLKKTRARTRPVSTHSAISINFTKGYFVARTRQNLVCSHRFRACVRQIGMASYLLEYMASYLLEYMASYLLEHGIIFIRIWHHIYWNMASYLLGYGIIFIGI